MKKIYLTQCSDFTACHGHGGQLAEESHSHHFSYQVTFFGPINEEGFLIDFRAVQDFLKNKINPFLDGADLNQIFTHPTTEMIAIWIFEQILPLFPQIYSVRVAEEADRWVEYKGGN
ncbi:MAG: 6-carboxytetrahydropterin synthase [Elusimicrobiaceae bacterium]|nr:6-carboxytetrahydropterin synthase [Elusimicrobiaceae bacterium]